VYEALQAGIEARGGSMTFQKEGYQWGAWKVTLGQKEGIFPSNGRGFPDFDRLKVENPNHWRDYGLPLIDGAIDKMIAKLK